ncbi:MAG: hypothetical protein AAB551_03120 [Patescibacteria group bacterium]
MKKILAFAVLGITLIISGCGEASVDENAVASTSVQKIVETVSKKTLTRLAEVQATGVEKNCQEFKEENIQAQCEETIRRNAPKK